MKKIVFLSGATASGKSNFAHKLIDNYFSNASILSVDSMQVYKHLNIGSAKPSKEEISHYRYNMIDLVEPTYNFNIKDYLDILKNIIEFVEEPIFAVGGTGFYIDALKYGIFEEDLNNKEKNKEIRKSLYERLDNEGLDSLYYELIKVDNEIVIDRYNARRVIRALEVYYSTGEKFSCLKKKRKPLIDFEYITYIIDIDRNVLYDNINLRVNKMFDNGLLEEVTNIIDMGVTSDNTSMQAIGYKECYDYIINNNMEKKELIDLIQKRTRNFAKRQLTWFRRENHNLINTDDESLYKVAKEVEAFYSRK